MGTTKSLVPTLVELQAELSQLQSRIATLRTESGKLKLAATKGDATAGARRTDLLAEIQTAQQDLVDVQAAIAEIEPQIVVERARQRVDDAKAVTHAIEELLAVRAEKAAALDVLIVAVGVAVRELIAIHQRADITLRRSMRPEDAVGIDTDHLAPVRATLSMLFAASGVDQFEAVRSLESLSFGMSLTTVERVAIAVAGQNSFLISLAESIETQRGYHLASLEEKQADETQEAAA